MGGHPDKTLEFHWVTDGGYVVSCRFAFGPLWLRIFLLSCLFLFVLFLVILCCTWHMSFHVKPTSRIPFYTHCRLYEGFWLVLHPLGLELDKANFLVGILSLVFLGMHASMKVQSWQMVSPFGIGISCCYPYFWVK